jgi:hypothetical protein
MHVLFVSVQKKQVMERKHKSWSIVTAIERCGRISHGALWNN